MGIWAGIKHALNSTLGTSDFKPLDKLIIEQEKMVASDELYESLVDGRVIQLGTSGGVVSYDNFPCLKMTRYGKLRLKGNLGVSLRGYVWACLKILKNGNVIANWELTIESELASKDFSTDISFEPGDVLSFTLTGENNYNLGQTISLSNFSVYGTIKQTAFINI